MIEPNHIQEIIGRMKSSAIETRLAAIKEAQEMFNGFFNSNDTLAEWSRKALTVETLYNLIREELKQAHVRIGHKHDESADVKVKETEEPKKKEPKKAFDFNSMLAEYAQRLGETK